MISHKWAAYIATNNFLHVVLIQMWGDKLEIQLLSSAARTLIFITFERQTFFKGNKTAALEGGLEIWWVAYLIHTRNTDTAWKTREK